MAADSTRSGEADGAGTEDSGGRDDAAGDPDHHPLVGWAFEHAINPLMTAILRSPLHGLVSEHLLLLTFTGRKTGTEYTTPLGYHREGDTLVVTTESPWWRNLEGGAPVTVRLRGERREGIATPVTDPEAVARRALSFVEENGAEAARRRFRIDVGDDPDLDDLEDAMAGRVAIEIDLDGPGAATGDR